MEEYEGLEKYDLQMSEVCREAFSYYYGSGITLFIDKENTFWAKYPKSDRLYCIGNIYNLEEMLMSMGGVGEDIVL